MINLTGLCDVAGKANHCVSGFVGRMDIDAPPKTQNWSTVMRASCLAHSMRGFACCSWMWRLLTVDDPQHRQPLTLTHCIIQIHERSLQKQARTGLLSFLFRPPYFMDIDLLNLRYFATIILASTTKGDHVRQIKVIWDSKEVKFFSRCYPKLPCEVSPRVETRGHSLPYLGATRERGTTRGLRLRISHSATNP